MCPRGGRLRRLIAFRDCKRRRAPMKTTLHTFVLWAALALPAFAQGGKPDARPDGKPVNKPAAEAAADKAQTDKAQTDKQRPKIALSDAGRSALAAAKEGAGRAHGAKGPERSH